MKNHVFCVFAVFKSTNEKKIVLWPKIHFWKIVKYSTQTNTTPQITHLNCWNIFQNTKLNYRLTQFTIFSIKSNKRRSETKNIPACRTDEKVKKLWYLGKIFDFVTYFAHFTLWHLNFFLNFNRRNSIYVHILNKTTFF